MATTGKNESRSATTELLPDVQRAVVQPDFTLNHYDIEHSAANFDVIGNYHDGTGVAYLRLIFNGSDPGTTNSIAFSDVLGASVKIIIDRTVSFGSFGPSSYNKLSTPPSVTVGYDGDGINDIITNLATVINTLPTYDGFRVKVRAASASTVLIIKQMVSGPVGNTAYQSDLNNVTFSNTGHFGGGETVAQAPFSKRLQLVRPIATSGLAISRNGHMTQG